MESLISVINKLQDAFNSVGSESIQLPQIVVVGAQSAGKSSVIESLVKGSFLPRGKGIVTRRPLVLQLIHCPMNDVKYRSTDDGTDNMERWGKFLHKKDLIYNDFDKIRQEIEDETDRIAGPKKGIVSEPINLKVFSPDVVNLTLVDLPGIIKVPVGDQPADIEARIIDLVMKYIKNPNSIILAVTAANADLATSEALKIAKDIDPEGIRTLAVLTKLDSMDEGTDAKDVLSGSVIPVKLGIIGVVNRSQMELEANKTMEEQLDKESKFLATKYPMLAAKNGTPYLEKTLSELLMNHINSCLPQLIQRISAKSVEVQSVLDSYGKEIANKETAIIQIISLFAKSYTATIEGIRACNGETCGSTKVYKIMHSKLGNALGKIMPCMNLDAAEALESLSNGSGPRPILFEDPSFDAPFEETVKKLLVLLTPPSLDCVDQVFNELVQNIRHCGSKVERELDRFPKLRSKIVVVVTKLLRVNLEAAKKMVKDVIAMEIAYINKEHPDFNKEEARLLESLWEGGYNQDKITFFMRKFKETANDNPILNEKQMNDCLILEKLVSKYFDIIRKSVQDAVPKAVVYFLINQTRNDVETELLKAIFRSKGTDEMLDESYNIMAGRKHAKDTLNALLVANQIISEVSDDIGGSGDH